MGQIIKIFMTYNFKTLDGIDLKGKKVLFRAAYDITLARQGNQWIVPDDMRIRATLPTLNYLLEQGCSIGILSWLKRPAGKVVEDLRMMPVAKKLSELIGKPVKALRDCVGLEVNAEIASMNPGDIIMLENVRFHPEEEKGDPEFAKKLAAGFDLIVYDAFAQAMRVHASTTGILELLPSAAGFLFIKEIEYLSRILENPARPFVVVLGGAKISDRVGVLQNLVGKADTILIGGALANTFLLSQGTNVGKSLVEDVFVDAARGEKQDYLAICRQLLATRKLRLPADLVSAPTPESIEQKIINFDRGEAIAPDWSFYDIGPRTISEYANILASAKMIFANGPMGLFEKEQFARGTKAVAESMIGNPGTTTVIGGGDTESIVTRYGWEGKFSHVSTGGGASLEFLAGKEFPVIKYLLANSD